MSIHLLSLGFKSDAEALMTGRFMPPPTDPLDTSSWAPGSGIQSPWIWCLGMLHDDPAVDPKIGAHYSFNVGASSNLPGANYVQLHGHDPTVIVKGGGGHPKG